MLANIFILYQIIIKKLKIRVTYLLKGTLILDALGSYKHPAVSEGQLLHCRASELFKQSARLVVQPVTGSENKVEDECSLI